jgi:hypothetical protein
MVVVGTNLDVHVWAFKITIQVNGEIENEEIVNMSIFTLHYTISKWNQNFLVDHSNYIFINLEHSFCKWFKFVKNNEHVYMN